MKKPKDGDRLDFSKKVETIAPPKEKWTPALKTSFTHEYGHGTPTPSPSLEEMAHLDVAEHYPFLLKGSPEYKRRHQEFLEKY